MKNWEHILQCKRFLFWKNAVNDEEVRFFIHHYWYECADVLRYKPLHNPTEDDYRKFLKDFKRNRKIHRENRKKIRDWEKTAYYIK